MVCRHPESVTPKPAKGALGTRRSPGKLEHPDSEPGGSALRDTRQGHTQNEMFFPLRGPKLSRKIGQSACYFLPELFISIFALQPNI